MSEQDRESKMRRAMPSLAYLVFDLGLGGGDVSDTIEVWTFDPDFPPPQDLLDDLAYHGGRMVLRRMSDLDTDEEEGGWTTSNHPFGAGKAWRYVSDWVEEAT